MPRADDANPVARTVQFASGETRPFKKSLQNVDMYCSKRDSNFTTILPKAPNANLFFLNYFSNRHFAQTKEKELEIEEN